LDATALLAGKYTSRLPGNAMITGFMSYLNIFLQILFRKKLK
jgi:hypothetical protein